MSPRWRRPVGYVVAGGGSLALDVLTLVVLRSGFGAPLALATSAGFMVGLVSNFWLNRQFVFSGTATVAASGVRYLTLVAFNYAMTVGIVTGLAAVGVEYLVAKAVAVALTLIWNFLALRHWVFAD